MTAGGYEDLFDTLGQMEESLQKTSSEIESIAKSPGTVEQSGRLATRSTCHRESRMKGYGDMVFRTLFGLGPNR
jgi:hypothetical protein